VTDINYLQRRFTHRQSEGVAHEKPSRVFRLLILTATFLLASAFALPQKAPNWAGWYTTAQAANGAKAYQKTCASCHAAGCDGSCGLRQAILADLCGQESFNAVVSGAHDDADDRAWLGISQEFDQYHGIPLAEKRCTGRQHTTQRRGRFVEGTSSELVDCIRPRGTKAFKAIHERRSPIGKYRDSWGESDVQ
jgi:hypothetical protein